MARFRQIWRAFLRNSDTGYVKLVCEKPNVHFEYKVENDRIIVKPIKKSISPDQRTKVGGRRPEKVQRYIARVGYPRQNLIIFVAS